MASGGNQNPCQFCINSAYKYIISRPVNYLHRELGFFHIDADRILSQNKSDLGTLNLPLDCQQLDLDLNVGFEEWKNPPNVQQHLDSLLFWILCNKEKMTFEDLGLNVDFVTSRGNLARILNVLSGKENKSWTLLATRYRHTIYLSHVEANEGHLSTYGRRILYWGKRFEVAVTKTDSNGKSDCDHGAEKYGPIKAYPGFYSVVRFQLQNHTILLRAEVDAQTQSTNEQPPEYVELKVATETIVHADWAFKQKRLVPWWCQSVVAGTPLIVYGTRDYDGHVKSISAVRTDEIPGIVGLENLDKDKYLLVLSEVLFWIENTVCREDHKVYAIQWDPEAKEMDVTARVLPCDDSNKFLRDWYVSEMEAYYASFSAKLREDSRDHGFISHIPPGARFSRTNDQWKGENANKTRKDNSNTDKMALKESWPTGSHDRVWEQAMPEIDDLEIRSEGRYSSERSVTDCQEQVEEARDRKWQTPTEVESIGYDKQSSRNRSPYSPNSRREPLRIDNKRIGKSKQGARQDHPQLQTTKTRNGARSRSYRHSRVSRGLARPAAPPRSPSLYDQKSQEEM